GMPLLEDEIGNSKHDRRAATIRKYLHLWHVVYFTRVVLLCSNPYRNGDLTDQRIVDIINHYNAYDMPLAENASSEDLLSALVCMQHQQLPFQEPWWTGIDAAQYIYTPRPQTSEFNIHHMVVNLFGVDYHTLLDLCLSIYILIHNLLNTNKQPSFTLEQLFKYLFWHEPQVVNKVVDSLSQTQEDYRKSCEKLSGSADLNLRKYHFNPLFSKPIIRIGKRYYVPVPMVLLLWVTKGIRYRLSEYAKQIGEDGKFYDLFGHAFEDFLADLFDRSGYLYIPEKKMLRKRNSRKTADFILPEGRRALIIDCKTRPCSLDHKLGVIDAIDRDFEKLIVGLEQCMSTKKLVCDGIIKGAGLDQVSEFTYAIVTLDNFYLANGDLIRRRVEKKLGVSIDYEILNIYEFELLVKNLKSRDLIESVSALAEGRCQMPASVKELVAKQIGSNAYDPCKESILALWDKFIDRVASAKPTVNSMPL
ncbi:MAG: hypothetical protein ACYC4F_05670, partial [Armatimonadota bacterium]